LETGGFAARDVQGDLESRVEDVEETVGEAPHEEDWLVLDDVKAQRSDATLLCR
jgi:hypothetical protein